MAEARDSGITPDSETPSHVPVEWEDFVIGKKLTSSLLIALNSAYKKHSSRQQSWQCAPRFDEVFQWMSCPPKTVRAIVLLMEPLPFDPSATCRSTGFALGMERQNTGSTIESCPCAVWKTIEILHRFRDADSWTQAAREAMLDRYNEGFNPKHLSDSGILFLNLSLTRGQKDVDDDLAIWWPFVQKLLSAIEKPAGVDRIAVIQLYNNVQIQKFLQEADDKYATYRPGFMDVDAEGGSGHVACFSDGQIIEFVDGLRRQGQHRRVVEEMADAVIDGSQCSCPRAALRDEPEDLENRM